MDSLKEKVASYIDGHREDIIKFLCAFISFKSVNPSDSGAGKELDAQKWVRERLEEFGFDKVDLWAVDEEKKRPNVVGTIKGKGEGKALIYNGHCDVVPVGENELKRWTKDPWKAVVKDGRVYGRGASDMKGELTWGLFPGIAR